MPRILVIEDELPLRRTLFDLLQAQGHRVMIESDGESGLSRALHEEIDLLVLDAMNPGCNGFALCTDIRRRLPELPILMLLAKGPISGRVSGLEAGADDCLGKPFSNRELLSRVRALFRRFDRDAAPVGRLSFGDVHIDFLKRHCTRAGSKVALTAKEFGVLELLVEHAGAPVTREHCLEVLWPRSARAIARTVDNQVLSLRAKLEADPDHPRHILTVHGVGYRLEITNS